MSVTYSTACKQARLEAVIAQIDASASAGTLEIGTTGMATILATLTLADPCGAASGATLTFDFDPDISNTADGTGTAAEARIKNGDGTAIITGLIVGVGSGDIQLDSVSITAGQTVTLTSGTITHA